MGDVGGYTVASGYRWLIEEPASFPLASVVWPSSNLPKHSVILWLYDRGKLLTKNGLLKIRMSMSSVQCAFCNANETIEHIFSDCSWLSVCVMLFVRYWAFSPVDIGADWMNRLAEQEERSNSRKGLLAAGMVASVYHTWLEMIIREHSGEVRDLQVVLHCVVQDMAHVSV